MRCSSYTGGKRTARAVVSAGRPDSCRTLQPINMAARSLTTFIRPKLPPTHDTPFVLPLFSQRSGDHRPAEDRKRPIIRQSDNGRLIAGVGQVCLPAVLVDRCCHGVWPKPGRCQRFDTLGNPALGAVIMSLIRRNACSSFDRPIWPAIAVLFGTLCYGWRGGCRQCDVGR